MSDIRAIYAPTLTQRANGYLQVLHALMLRDMRTRFGGSHWGYCITVLWPVTHVVFITTLMVVRGVPSAVGGSTFLFIATGAVPCLTFQYISRLVMLSVMMNKPLTYYPQVKVFDVMLARIIVEIVTGFSGLIVVCALLVALGIDPVPAQPIVAIQGYMAAIFLGIAVGTVNVGIIHFFPAWSIGYILMVIVLYMFSGVYFLPNLMPEQLYAIAKWNPLLQIVEWVRLGYTPSLPVVVDKLYVLLFGGVALTIGMLLERHVVRKS